jgi:sterol desaturase/sphingolipid hydroxylase (fatty acid hydroxylase superfamily)
LACLDLEGLAGYALVYQCRAIWAVDEATPGRLLQAIREEPMPIAQFAGRLILALWPLAALTLIGLMFERVRPGRPNQTTDWRNNLRVWGVGLAATVTALPVAGGWATLLVNALGGGAVRLPDTGWALAFGAMAYVGAMDAGEYLFHRAQHAIPALWAMHSLHHSDPACSVTTTTRHFWLESSIKSLTVWMAVGLLFRASPKIVAIYGVVQLYHFVLHANLRAGFGPLSWLLNSPQYHRLHHSRDPLHHNRNFAALFPIFDLVSGGYRKPGRDEYPATGLDDARAPRTLWDALAWPLARPSTGRAAEASQARFGAV